MVRVLHWRDSALQPFVDVFSGQFAKFPSAKWCQDVSLGERRVVGDGLLAAASQSEAEPVSHRVADGIGVSRSRRTIVLVPEQLAQLGPWPQSWFCHCAYE